MTGRPRGNSPSDYGREPAHEVARDRPQHDVAAPPRKLAVGDPGFSRFGPRVRILLDGEEIKRCTAYDVDKGIVTRQRLDEAGRIFVDHETDRVATETLSGAVKVMWR